MRYSPRSWTALSRQYNFPSLPEDEAHAPREIEGNGDLRRPPENAAVESVPEVTDASAIEHDRVLDLRSLDDDVLADRGVRPKKGIRDVAAGADDHRSADSGRLEARRRVYGDAALDLDVTAFLHGVRKLRFGRTRSRVRRKAQKRGPPAVVKYRDALDDPRRSNFEGAWAVEGR